MRKKDEYWDVIDRCLGTNPNRLQLLHFYIYIQLVNNFLFCYKTVCNNKDLIRST